MHKTPLKQRPVQKKDHIPLNFDYSNNAGYLVNNSITGQKTRATTKEGTPLTINNVNKTKIISHLNSKNLNGDFKFKGKLLL